MLRTAAHCVHVLTLPIENSMLARWRTFIARADNSCVSFMELALIYFLLKYQQLWTKVYTPAYHWKAYDSGDAMVHTNMSVLAHKWASMSITEHTCSIMSVNSFSSNLTHFRVSRQKLYSHLLIIEQVCSKMREFFGKYAKIPKNPQI